MPGAPRPGDHAGRPGPSQLVAARFSADGGRTPGHQDTRPGTMIRLIGPACDLRADVLTCATRMTIASRNSASVMSAGRLIAIIRPEDSAICPPNRCSTGCSIALIAAPIWSAMRHQVGPPMYFVGDDRWTTPSTRRCLAPRAGDCLTRRRHGVVDAAPQPKQPEPFGVRAMRRHGHGTKYDAKKTAMPR
jgi:hypothetical protein